ncbi:hypothetical protein SBY92_004734 [Candida maltosa Xu316]|uniref:Calcineurin-like phosphoesterase domain-containing protein n=1 Tax=Candida maltosa (strain Xu316) TaxID=1245528 RepID=M3HJM7_CANMX|nr:hypothetical protein G210_2039 [Candida maltosa Xu316]
MSESTPLNKRPVKYSEDESQPYDDYITDDEFTISTNTKIVIGTIVAFLTLVTLYIFTIFLPSYFIPEGITLTTIQNISELKSPLLPSNPHSRMILIGDIHGHYIEFRNLLSKVKYNSKKDTLVVLGDFITKGPDSFKMLEFLIDNDVECILGNHEYYVLQNYAMFHRLDQPEFAIPPIHDHPISIDDSYNDDPEFLLAKKLQPRHVRYINSCSVIKKLGRVPGGMEGIAVHAGVRPDLTLSEQDPIDNLEMRSLIGPFYNESTSDPTIPGAKSWSKVYNWKNGEAPANYTVYYGHDAGRGLKLKEFTKGLDSRCDRGGKLSAMVISTDKKKKDKLVEEIVQVHC